jgi:uncharacterized protein (DUF2236 family)
VIGRPEPVTTTHGCGTAPDSHRLPLRRRVAFGHTEPHPTPCVNHARTPHRGVLARIVVAVPSLTVLRGLPQTPDLPDPVDALESGVAEARRRLAASMRRMIVGDAPPPRDLRTLAGDTGLFGPESVTWRVHADAAMFIGGLRALLLQTMHPLAMAGVADHSDYHHDPMGRLWRTSVYVGTTTYGTTAEAEAAVAMVKRVHARVVGTAPDGRSYAANDPHLLTWVHHAEVDSFLAAYQRYGAEPLTRAEADRYVDEMAVLCELFDAEPAARSVAELRAYFHSMKPELRAGRQARDAARWLMVPPLPWPARLAYAVIAPAAVGLLPAATRRSLWLPMAPGVDPLLVRPAARALTRSLAWVMAGLEVTENAADQDTTISSPSPVRRSPAA